MISDVFNLSLLCGTVLDTIQIDFADGASITTLVMPACPH
jgi:hypothetical protein